MARKSRWEKSTVGLLDYKFRWGDWLREGDSIQRADITITPSGLTLEQTAIEGGDVFVWVSGGVDHANYRIVCQIETADGRIDQKKEMLRIKPI